jgi:hypothetical protein
MRIQAALEKLGSVGVFLLVVGWILSAPFGMIFWTGKGWLLGVVLSLIIPGFGIITTVATMLS